MRNILILVILFVLKMDYTNGSYILANNNTEQIYIRTVRYFDSKKIDKYTSIIVPISLDQKKLDTCKIEDTWAIPNGSVVIGVGYGKTQKTKITESNKIEKKNHKEKKII